ncbi:hypothetical protein BSZ39_05705 [Bowdeniella nasicola]|uniref:Uncharacterized protein n=1 Tax=Bowdeniella nasicola TaxID=208480 RepID=A0A1Q5Q324_9ACTO|nr:hypothetical protein [Bowdeniella nasicola]OKL54155.1 hypothetical protein BSZ39_05705 [Bowdeniella nasicola]
MPEALRLRLAGFASEDGLVEVVDHTDALVGHCSVAELPGCARSGTFRFSPISGADVTMGIRRRGIANPLRNRFVIAHASGTDEIQESKLANFLRFNAAGIVAGHELDVRARLTGAIAIGHDGQQIASITAIDRHQSYVDVVSSADERLLGISVLMLLIYRRHHQQADIVAEYFGGR